MGVAAAMGVATGEVHRHGRDQVSVLPAAVHGPEIPWELNVVAGYEIKKGTLFGVSVVWKDEDLRDRALVLNLSTSFGTLE